MSEFGNTIKNLIPYSSSAREIALKIGVHPSAFSKFITGVRVSCNPETLEKICLGVSSKKSEQAELLAAYLRDQRLASVSHMVEIRTVTNGKAAVTRPSQRGHLDTLCQKGSLDADTINALAAIIRRAPHSRALRRTLADLSAMTEEFHPVKPDPRPSGPQRLAR